MKTEVANGVTTENLKLSTKKSRKLNRKRHRNNRNNMKKISDEGLEEEIKLKSSGSTTKFLVELYERLEEGGNMLYAAGHSMHDKELMQADAVRTNAGQVVVGGKTTTVKFILQNVNKKALRTELWFPCSSGKHSNKKVTIRYLSNNNEVIAKKTMKLKLTRSQIRPYGFTDVTKLLENTEAVSVEFTLRNKANSNQLEEITPMLVSFSKDGAEFLNSESQSSKRSKRSIILDNVSKKSIKKLKTKSEKRQRRKGCQKKDFIVDFEELGWDSWIVYPKQFNAYQCSGGCPNPIDESYNPTNHALIQSLMKFKKPDSVKKGPCCVPSKLKPLSMLYYEGDQLVVKHHAGMIADRCACR
ncbi:unnamed protein product [Owenia fusiformis]|uniref:Uncharacterized protein n=1 Tax=Owenia fusiformis TaxID=6347 RepID=A0A8J1Y7D5_OWEFU|nr:unnamed protein product [Owenia fusiformis]